MWKVRRIKAGVILYIGKNMIGAIRYRSDNSFELLFPLDDEDELQAKEITSRHMGLPINRRLINV